MAWESFMRVKTYKHTTFMYGSNHTDIVEAERLAQIICAAAKGCAFERKKDLFLSEVLKPKLHAERIVNLAWGQPPMRAIPDQYGDGEETNDLVAPFIDIPLGVRAKSIDFRTDKRIDAFVFATAILQEIVDKDNIRIYSNTEVPFSETDNVCQLYVCCSNFTGVPAGFGVIMSQSMISTSADSCYPIMGILLNLIRRRIAADLTGASTASFRSLLECCEEQHPSASNVFLKYINSK